MSGVDLFDGLTRAVPSLKACCVKTLNSATNVVNPEARKAMTVTAESGALRVELRCPVCKTTHLIHVDRGSVRVESAPTPAN